MLLKSVMKCPGAPLRGSFHAPKVPTKTLVSSVGRVLGRTSRAYVLPSSLLPKRKWKKWRDVRFFVH
jgi:hypothetical protein